MKAARRAVPFRRKSVVEPDFRSYPMSPSIGLAIVGSNVPRVLVAFDCHLEHAETAVRMFVVTGRLHGRDLSGALLFLLA